MDKRLLPYMLLNVMKNEKAEEKRIGKLLTLLHDHGYGDEDDSQKEEFEVNRWGEGNFVQSMNAAHVLGADQSNQLDGKAYGTGSCGFIRRRDVDDAMKRSFDYGRLKPAPATDRMKREYRGWFVGVKSNPIEANIKSLQEMVLSWIAENK